ncbi:MAG: hypothetical protein KKA73_11470 [Chloroflexi bacterium]|nr:hypothetical protein [Chloroflexota bacterium]MBU1748298.1 hypothetical protein [Chloroflexota bacterium]MBU1877340.1 hypothetical protein [Chloroflexota bacterium]
MSLPRVLLLGCLLLVPLLAGCQVGEDDRLTIVYPTATTERTGGQTLRITLSLADNDGQPVDGAMVQADLQLPDGSVLTTLDCVDKGQGHYLADYVTLPLRGAGGEWRVIARATWGDGQQARAERAFKGLPSVSERLQKQYGFWIDPPNLFEYNEVHPADPHFEERIYPDGGGYVLLENNIPRGTSHLVVNLDVHWQAVSFPADEAAAIAHVRGLGAMNRHNSNPPSLVQAAQQTTFQGRPAWIITGQWEYQRSERTSSVLRPAEWLILSCPGSAWVWTIAISTNEPAYMDDLRVLRETFECPTP